MRARIPIFVHTLAAILLLAAVAAPAATAARDPAPGFAEHSLELPGMPAAVIPADLDADGRRDLVVLVAYTGWGQRAETERVRFDGIEGLVEVMDVVTGLVDRRELRLYRALEGGGYAPSPAILELDTSLHALQATARGWPLLAVTDAGVAAVRWSAGDGGGALALEPLLDVETAFTGSETFYSDFRFAHDLDGDGEPELLLPTAGGWSVFRAGEDGFAPEPAALVADVSPDEGEQDDGSGEPIDDGEDRREGDDRARRPLQPAVGDLDADGRPDLLVLGGGRDPVAWLGRDGLRFSPAIPLAPGATADAAEEVVHVGRLDEGPETWLVTQKEIEPSDDAGMREEIDHAKRPLHSYALYRLGSGLRAEPAPNHRFRAVGYTFQGDDGDEEDETDIRLPGGFQDLDGDGRLDLVAITLDFSVAPLIFRALVMRRLSLRMDFHPWCQGEDGGFREVPGLDLSGKFKIDLRNVQVKHLSQFAGDFDGDGRADFVQLGRGRKATIHLGEAGCSYPPRPSRKIRFAREPRHLGLVRIADVDGDGRSDLYVVHPLRDPGSGASIPARVDLYVSSSGASPPP